MAAIRWLNRFLIHNVFIALIYTRIEIGAGNADADVEIERSDEPKFFGELDRLKSRINSLEMLVEGNAKDQVIAEKETVIKEKLDTIVSLQTEIASLRLSDQLLKQVESLYKEIRELEAQKSGAEKRVMELSSRRGNAEDH